METILGYVGCVRVLNRTVEVFIRVATVVVWSDCCIEAVVLKYCKNSPISR